MAIQENTAGSPTTHEDLSRTTARLSISQLDSGTDLKKVRQMLSEAQNAKKGPGFSLSPFDDENDTADESVSKFSDSTVQSETASFLAKRRRSSAHSVALVKGKVHKRKSKWTVEPLTLEFSPQVPEKISLIDLRFLVLNLLRAKGACKTPLFEVGAPWKLKNVVFAFVPGLCDLDFGIEKAQSSESGFGLRAIPSGSDTLPFASSHFQYSVPTSLPESMPSLVNLFLQFPLTKAGKKKRAAEMKDVKLVLPDLLLTHAQMESNRYPIHSLIDASAENALKEGWAETRDFEHEGSHTFALDCEFCRAESGQVLTRISIVNFQNEVVYDQLVKPAEEITDYLTRYSGITEEMLKDETTTLKDVQEKVLSIVSAGDILIGHSLNSDLNVMKIRHPKIIDTSLMFDHHRGHPFKHSLKHLADVYLARTIQNGEKDGTGHSSVEDLQACLDLVKLKLIEGPDFGKVVGLSLFRNAADANAQIKSALIDYLMSEYGSLLEDAKEPMLKASLVNNDDEAVDTSIAQLDSKTFHLLWLRELQYNCTKKSAPANFTGQIIDGANSGDKAVSAEGRKSLLSALDKRLQRLYDALPADSLLIVNTGGGDPTRMNYLNYIKRLFQRELKAGKDVADFSEEELWNFSKATELAEATDLARLGATFLALKK